MKINPCPPYKHRPKAIKYRWMDNRSPDYWRVVCSCGRRGPAGATRKEAVVQWNRYGEERGT